MAADDMVNYNGIQMRRDYAESLEATPAPNHFHWHPGCFGWRVEFAYSKSPKLHKLNIFQFRAKQNNIIRM
jgi:hypothetical protein